MVVVAFAPRMRVLRKEKGHEMKDSLEIMSPKGLVHYMDVIIGSCWDRICAGDPSAFESFVSACKKCIDIAEKKQWIKK